MAISQKPTSHQRRRKPALRVTFGLPVTPEKWKNDKPGIGRAWNSNTVTLSQLSHALVTLQHCDSDHCS